MIATRPVRILHVLNSLNAGGLENGVVNVANSLEGTGFEFHYACLDPAGRFVSRLKAPRVVELGRRDGFSITAVWRLARLLRRVRPDIVHTHNLGPLLYTVLSAWPRRPVILHGEHSELSSADLAGRRLRQRRFLYRRCAMLHAVSLEQGKKLAEHRLAPVEVRAIVNGVDSERFQPGDKVAARARLGIPPEAQVVGIAGRFGPQKRHDAFLEAIGQLASNPRLHALVVGGGGPLEKTIREQACKNPAAARIHFTGFQQDMVPFLQAMNLLAIPSENEGMSNVMLEAMACGVPVLANVVCGAREVIADGVDGLVRDLSTAARIAEEIAAALKDPAALDGTGGRARRTILDHHALQSMTSAYRDVYSRLGGPGAPRPAS